MTRNDQRLNASIEYLINTPAWPRLLARLEGAHTPCRPGAVPAAEWESDDPADQRRAADLCQSCAVLADCRAYALTTGETGLVMGGLTRAELKRTRRARRVHPATQKVAA